MRRLLLFPALFTAACGISFPAEYRVEDLRILNVVTDPPEVPIIAEGFTATSAEQLIRMVQMHPNTEEVTLTGLVAHPDIDATFTYSWKACTPLFAPLPCGGSRRRDLSEDETSTVTFQPIVFLANELLEGVDPMQAISQLATDPRDLLNGLYAHLILRAAVDQSSIPADTEQLDAEKRLVIFDPSVTRVTIREAKRLAEMGELPEVPGLELPTLCTQASADDLVAIEQFLNERQRNRLPRFLGISSRTTTSTTAEIVESVELRPGGLLELRGIFDTLERERYQLIDDNCRLVDLKETFSFSWFTNLGSFSNPLTVAGDANDLDQQLTTYTAPAGDELEGEVTRVRIWAVLRDGRGGSAHRQLDVTVRMP